KLFEDHPVLVVEHTGGGPLGRLEGCQKDGPFRDGPDEGRSAPRSPKAYRREAGQPLPMSAPTKPVDVNDAEFAQFVKSHPNVVVDAWAPWCGPCKRIAPIMDELAAEYNGQVAIAKLNTDDNQATAMRYGIMSIPTLLV